MIIKCPKCQSKYQLPEEKITTQEVKVRCQQCETIMLVKKPKPKDEAPSLFDSCGNDSPAMTKDEPTAKAEKPSIFNMAPPEEHSGIFEKDPNAFNEMPEEDFSQFPDFDENRETLEEDEIIKGSDSLRSGLMEQLAAIKEQTPLEKNIVPSVESAELKKLKEEEEFVSSSKEKEVAKKAAKPIKPPVEIKPSYSNVISRIIILLLCLSVLGFLLLRESSVVLEDVISKYRKLMPVKEKVLEGVAVKGFTLFDLQCYYVKRDGKDKVFVISGKVKNDDRPPKNFIQLKGDIVGPFDKKLAEKQVYCGNTFTREELAHLSREEIERQLQTKLGKSLANFNVQPQRSVSFMIVFFDVPDDVISFHAEVIGWQKSAG